MKFGVVVQYLNPRGRLGLIMKDEQIKKRQKYPLEIKEGYTIRRIREWYQHWHGQVYVAFSGGFDSTVLLHIVRQQFPEVPAVFVDTGLEYPENKELVKKTENCRIIKPKISFNEIIKKYGYPVISKRSARFISDLQNPTSKNEATRNLRLTGYNRQGVYCPSMLLAKKWHYLVDAPFKISDYCCEALKKEPMKRYARTYGQLPMIGVMAADSGMREKEYQQYGCNMYELKSPKSHVLGFWTRSDILKYIQKYEIPYSKVYGEIKMMNGDLTATGEQHTGCMFCMFGCHLEKNPNRFQRMKLTHPKQWDYCINKLGLREILDYINILYE